MKRDGSDLCKIGKIQLEPTLSLINFYGTKVPENKRKFFKLWDMYSRQIRSIRTRIAVIFYSDYSDKDILRSDVSPVDIVIFETEYETNKGELVEKIKSFDIYNDESLKGHDKRYCFLEIIFPKCVYSEPMSQETIKTDNQRSRDMKSNIYLMGFPFLFLKISDSNIIINTEDNENMTIPFVCQNYPRGCTENIVTSLWTRAFDGLFGGKDIISSWKFVPRAAATAMLPGTFSLEILFDPTTHNPENAKVDLLRTMQQSYIVSEDTAPNQSFNSATWENFTV